MNIIIIKKIEPEKSKTTHILHILKWLSENHTCLLCTCHLYGTCTCVHVQDKLAAVVPYCNHDKKGHSNKKKFFYKTVGNFRRPIWKRINLKTLVNKVKTMNTNKFLLHFIFRYLKKHVDIYHNKLAYTHQLHVFSYKYQEWSL